MVIIGNPVRSKFSSLLCFGELRLTFASFHTKLFSVHVGSILYLFICSFHLLTCAQAHQFTGDFHNKCVF